MTTLVRLLGLAVLCCSCLCNSTDSGVLRRQKRGLMKMMMHVMWDPVRLIRYWYAYDVTKEIAKSWRKIIPTMFFLPFGPPPGGVAKYVNPIKFREDSGKRIAHHPTISKAKNDHYHGVVGQSNTPIVSSVEKYSDYIQRVVEQPNQSKRVYSEMLPAVDSYEFFPQLKQGVSESNIDSIPVRYWPHAGSGAQFLDADHFILKPLRQGSLSVEPSPQSSERKDEQLMPFPYKIHIPNAHKNQVLMKAIRVPLEKSHVHWATELNDDPMFSGENVEVKPGHHRSQLQQIRARFPPVFYGNDAQNENDPSSQPEIHIVLHPIPIDNLTTKEIQTGFYFNPNTTNDEESLVDHLPSILKGSGLAESLKEEIKEIPVRTKVRGQAYEMNTANVSNYVLKENNDSSSEVYEAKPTTRVIWFLKRRTLPDSAEKRTPLNRENERDSSGDRSNQSQQSSHQLNGVEINLAKLKEDLKHGTPVLIPYNKPR